MTDYSKLREGCPLLDDAETKLKRSRDYGFPPNACLPQFGDFCNPNYDAVERRRLTKQWNDAREKTAEFAFGADPELKAELDVGWNSSDLDRVINAYEKAYDKMKAVCKSPTS